MIGQLFHRESYVLVLTKKTAWAIFGVAFSQTHPVTLLASKQTI
jgi:hypothetical protein